MDGGKLSQLTPLFGGGIDASWVMAATVKHHQVASRGILQATQQAIKVQRMVGSVIVGIFPHLQTHGGEDVFMVWPAWVADSNALSIGLIGDKVSRYPQGTGATGRLHGTCALVSDDRALFTEQQLLRAVGEYRNTFNTEIVFGGLILQQILLSFFDAG